MTANDGIERLLSLVIVQNFTFIAANIGDKLLERLQISKAIEIVACAVVLLIIAHPMCARPLLIIQINYTTFVFATPLR